jgi:hypothetical protein
MSVKGPMMMQVWFVREWRSEFDRFARGSARWFGDAKDLAVNNCNFDKQRYLAPFRPSPLAHPNLNLHEPRALGSRLGCQFVAVIHISVLFRCDLWAVELCCLSHMKQGRYVGHPQPLVTLFTSVLEKRSSR